MQLDPDDERILGLDMAALRIDLEQRGLSQEQVEAAMEIAIVIAAQS